MPIILVSLSSFSINSSRISRLGGVRPMNHYLLDENGFRVLDDQQNLRQKDLVKGSLWFNLLPKMATNHFRPLSRAKRTLNGVTVKPISRSKIESPIPGRGRQMTSLV